MLGLYLMALEHLDLSYAHVGRREEEFDRAGDCVGFASYFRIHDPSLLAYGRIGEIGRGGLQSVRRFPKRRLERPAAGEPSLT